MRSFSWNTWNGGLVCLGWVGGWFGYTLLVTWLDWDGLDWRDLGIVFLSSFLLLDISSNYA
jgi:hypothetical protein